MRNYHKKFRGGPELIRERLSDYIGYFSGCRNVLDLGCGNGEFMGLLREAGVPAIGVDSDPEAIEVCRQAGHDVKQDDFFAFLEASRGFDGIMASQVIEHLDCASAETLLEKCYGALKSNGVVVLITPNPENLTAITKTFWLDPTHVRPYPLELLIAMLRNAGFEIAASGDAVNTRPGGLKGAIKRSIGGPILKLLGLGQLKAHLFSGHDIFAVGRKQ
jgi:O-antigen chain-terminating methyltransferase